MKGGLCMARPSIFSREYERHKKRRKKVIAFTVIFILAAAGVLLAGGNIKNVVVSKANYYRNTKLFTIFMKDKKEEAAPSIAPEKSESQVESGPQENSSPQTDSSAQPPVEEVKETGYDIQLSDGSMIKAVYENIDGINKFKQIVPMSTNVSSDINPSGNAMVILDSISQNMKFVDISGNIQDITAAQYISTDKKSYNKEDVLEKYKKYNYGVFKGRNRDVLWKDDDRRLTAPYLGNMDDPAPTSME
jgi:hypothetical protein